MLKRTISKISNGFYELLILWGPAPLRRRKDLEAGMLQTEHARTCKQMQDKACRLNQIKLINFASV